MRGTWNERLGAALWGVVAWLAAMASALAQEPLPLSLGQTIYVPVYSHLWHGNVIVKRGEPERVDVSTLVSVRNVDPRYAITIESARYFDSDGKLVREHTTAAKEVPALATFEYFVEQKDLEGGSGANFLIRWTSKAPANPPMIEAVTVYFRGAQSFAFNSPGRVIRTGDE